MAYARFCQGNVSREAEKNKGRHFKGGAKNSKRVVIFIYRIVFLTTFRGEIIGLIRPVLTKLMLILLYLISLFVEKCPYYEKLHDFQYENQF